jgi:hypothetical protein
MSRWAISGLSALQQKTLSFNHLIGANKHWHSDAESLGRFEVDD